jgi:hypothetical protein
VILYTAKRMRRVGRVRVGAGPHGVWTSPTE